LRKIDGFNRLPLETKRGLIWDWVPMHNVEHQLSGMEEPFFIGFTGKLVSSVHPVSWSSPQKVVHLLVWEINPIRNMKGGLKWLKKDTNPKKS
jgi:hypothetical protein